MPLVRLDQDAHPEYVHRRGNQVFSGELLLRGKTGPLRSDAWHVRSRIPQLHAWQIADSETARRLQSATGRRILITKVPQRTPQSRHAARSSPPRDHAQRPEQDLAEETNGRHAVIE